MEGLNTHHYIFFPKAVKCFLLGNRSLVQSMDFESKPLLRYGTYVRSMRAHLVFTFFDYTLNNTLVVYASAFLL